MSSDQRSRPDTGREAPDERVQEGNAVDDGADAVPEFENGRYVYCVVDASPEAIDRFSTDGLDDEPVSVIGLENNDCVLGAVVHSCDSLYDTADLRQVKRWLVRHQTVIDRAGEAFGTPLPFQFHTIFRGDDDTVREWLRDQRDALEDALDALADHWEYRIDVVETDPPDGEDLLEEDAELAALDEQIENASEGRAFLLEKQFEQRVKAIRGQRRAEIRETLRAGLEQCSQQVHALERQPSVDLGGEFGQSVAPNGERLCRFTILASEEEESTVGSVLDEVAENPGLEVRFTGPWPPYSFAPTFGDETALEGGDR